MSKKLKKPLYETRTAPATDKVKNSLFHKKDIAILASVLATAALVIVLLIFGISQPVQETTTLDTTTEITATNESSSMAEVYNGRAPTEEEIAQIQNESGPNAPIPVIVFDNDGDSADNSNE